MKTTNCKQVIESVQKYLLNYMDDYKQSVPEWANEPNEVAFVRMINQYIDDYGANEFSWRTPRGVLITLAEGGAFDCYYSQIDDRLTEWGLNPERYTDDKNWETYKNLIGRDGERLYNKIKKGQTKWKSKQ